LSKHLTGTREWAEHSVNCYLGCPHDCRYCYAREAAVRRKLTTWEDWKTPRANMRAVKRRYGPMPGRVMFPTTHDITPTMLPECMTVLRNLLTAGNEVLVTSKPHLRCIEWICRDFGGCAYRPLLEFRFTITSGSDQQLAYWEPGAPSLADRYAALAYAKAAGWRTSVSIEPCLDWPGVEKLIRLVEPQVTGTIWIGLLNRPKARVRLVTPQDHHELEYVLSGQTPGRVRAVWERNKGNPKLRWKDSVRRMLGLPAAMEPE